MFQASSTLLTGTSWRDDAPELPESTHKGVNQSSEDVTQTQQLVDFMYPVFTRKPGESDRRRLRSSLWLCDVFRALINSLVC